MIRSSSLRRLNIGAALMMFVATGAPAQTTASAVTQSARPAASAYFTTDDALEINSATVADLSDDGRWIAPTQSVR